MGELYTFRISNVRLSFETIYSPMKWPQLTNSGDSERHAHKKPWSDREDESLLFTISSDTTVCTFTDALTSLYTQGQVKSLPGHLHTSHIPECSINTSASSVIGITGT